MRLLTNPIALRMILMLIGTAFAFWVGVVLIRRLRRSITAEATIGPTAASADSLRLHTYNAVIQELKQQKHELQSQQQAERRRAKTSENISAAVLSHLSSGVLFLTPDGLIRQANGAAKHILGFASPVGLSTAQVFRNAPVTSGGDSASLAETISRSLREKTPYLRLETHYATPGGQERSLDVTITAVNAPTGEPLGAACLISDQSEMAQVRRQQQLMGEMSAEMALELRNSLNSISGYAQQLAAGNDPASARQIAADIIAEAGQLQHTVGGFLAGRAAGTASGS
jgi:nitrogen fixation/metabolism regulation signal transduction histidine kinase